jgi:DNA-binding CsgD family transcriptional regulator
MRAGWGGRRRSARVPIGPPKPTPREREVAGLLGDGKTVAETAIILGISRETASTHAYRLMQKLDLRNRAEVVRWALSEGLSTL